MLNLISKAWVAAMSCLFITHVALAESIRFPADGGVVDVTKAPYFAVPDDGEDDAAAIQRALNDHVSGNVIFYFPDGVYDLSDALPRLPEGDPLRNTRAVLELRDRKKRNILQGQSEAGTVLRLMDSVPKEFDKAMLNFGQAPAQRFRNSLRNMTVSVGVGHPQATAVEFNASNQGTVHRVTIRSEDVEYVGRVGLDMAHTDEVGPLLVRHLTVEGFDVGIRTAYQTASQTFQDVTLRHQRRFGWRNGFGQQVFVHRLRSENGVTVIANIPGGGGDPGQGKFVLVDAELKGLTGAEMLPAIRNQKSMYLRDIKCEGYGRVVSREIQHYRGNQASVVDSVEEYWANGAFERRRGGSFSLFPSPQRMLKLPIKATPDVEWEQDFSKWAGPHRFAEGEPGNGSGFPNDGNDDTAALQRAVDSGANTIYLPNGVWRVDGTVIVPATVRRIVGCEARLVGGEEDDQGVLRIDDGTTHPIVIERLESGKLMYRHFGQRTLVLNHILGGRYERGAPDVGELYLNDVVLGPLSFRDQQVWARQLDIEGDQEVAGIPKIRNDNSRVWILGYKTEDAGITMETLNDGLTEVYGALHVGGAGKAPRFRVDDAAFSIAGVYGGGFETLLEETRGGEIRTAVNFRNADLVTAYNHEVIADEEMVIDLREQVESVEWEGKWIKADAFPGGFLGGEYFHDGNADKGRKSVSVTFPAGYLGKVVIDVHHPPQRSGFGLAKRLPVVVRYGEQAKEVVVDQSKSGGQWVLVAELNLVKPNEVSVEISNTGTKGFVALDAVRLRRVE